MAEATKVFSSGDQIARNRWLVHLSLIFGFFVALVSALFLSRRYLGLPGTKDHALWGLLVLGLVVVHLVQRRRTVRSLLTRLRHRGRTTGRRSRLGESDLILGLLMLNATISGVADYLVGHTIYLPVPGPYVLQKWHAVGSIVLLIYVIVHVVRRRTRIRTSHVR